MYHGLRDRPLGPVSLHDGNQMEVRKFVSQIEYILKHYNLVSLDRIVSDDQSNKEKPHIAITFDDGFANNFYFAYPLLKKYHIPATFFIVTGFVGSHEYLWPDIVNCAFEATAVRRLEIEIDGEVLLFDLTTVKQRVDACKSVKQKLREAEHRQIASKVRELCKHLKVTKDEIMPNHCRILTWQHIEQMDPSLIDIGSHTVSHCILDRISVDEARQELINSKKTIEERLQKEVRHFCYPNGNFNSEIIELVKKAGYQSACTTIGGLNLNRVDPYKLRRIWCSDSHSRKDFVSKINVLAVESVRNHEQAGAGSRAREALPAAEAFQTVTQKLGVTKETSKESIYFQLNRLEKELKILDDLLSDKDSELAILQETLTQIYSSLTWRLMRKCDVFVNWFLPPYTRRRLLYSNMISALDLLSGLGRDRLWIQIKQILKRIFHKIDGITEAEMADNRTRLMVVIPSMELGGTERCTSLLLEHLNRALIKPELVTIFEREAFYPIPEDIRIYCLEKLKSSVLLSYSLSLENQLQRYINVYAWMEMTAFKLARVIQKRQPSVIWAEDYYSSVIVLLARRHIPPAIKVIVSVRCFLSGMLSLDKHGELIAFLTRKLFNNADRVITNDETISQDLVENFNARPEKIVALFNIFNFEQVQKLSAEAVTEHIWFDEDIPIVLFVGRLSNVKGLVYLLSAVFLIKKSARLRCVLIGEGEEKETLHQMAQHLGVADDMLFLGRQQNPFKFMRKATLLVLPSRCEGLPNVLIEALACSCPVIATDCPGGGPAEILKDGEYGLLVPPMNIKALSDAILRLLQDHELREKFSTRGPERARDFDLGLSLKAYEDIILSD